MKTKKEFADELLKKAKKVLNYDLKQIKGDPELENDKEYKKHIKDDYKDLCAIATLIREGSFKKAWKKIDNLDTTTREVIPDKVYDYVGYKAK